MFFNKKKKNSKTCEEQSIQSKIPLSIGDLYLKCANRYISYQGKIRCVENPLDDKDFYKEHATSFYNGAMYFVNYLENMYTDDILSEDNVIDLDLNKMLECADEATLSLFNSPKFPSLIYLNDSNYPTHFHTDGDVVYDTEYVQVLPGLSTMLANEKINKLFNGLTPIEVRALLVQMGIYPPNTELDKVIDSYLEKVRINQDFLKAVIYLLLIRLSNYGITRARLFADSLNIPFDFKPFEKEDKQVKKLENKRS